MHTITSQNIYAYVTRRDRNRARRVGGWFEFKRRPRAEFVEINLHVFGQVCRESFKRDVKNV